jgi:pimeloyl-ACP methyl ester carboxylesterase
VSEEASVAAIALYTPKHLEHRVTTVDGRVLAVAEWGDPQGLALFDLHGTPGGRISYWQDPSIDARYGIRRITYDRPGYGESTRLPGRNVADAVPDVVAIADALGIDRFAVTGGSGGGPHALACATLLRDRVLRCLLEATPAPCDAEGLDWLAGQTAGNIAEWGAAVAGEDSIRAIAQQERLTVLERLAVGRTDILGDAYELSRPDQEQLARHIARVADDLGSALAHGVDGWVDDDIAFTRPWGFAVAPLSMPAYITYGRLDTLVPAAHGDWLAAHIPNATVVVLDGAGHLGDDAQVEKHYAWLAGR